MSAVDGRALLVYQGAVAVHVGGVVPGGGVPGNGDALEGDGTTDGAGGRSWLHSRRQSRSFARSAGRPGAVSLSWRR